MQAFTDVKRWCRENPLTAGVGVWSTGMVGTGAYVYSRKMPVALKVITARMYAQAGVVLAVCTAGLVTYLGQEEKSGPSQSSVQMREYKADGTAR